jgi:hypothetical protein
MPVVNTLTVTSIALFAGFAVASGADKEPHFAPGAPASYRTRQTNDKVTIAAVAYATEEQVRSAFGKLDPNRYGILPLLIVMQNDGSKTLRLESMRVEYVTADRKHVDATPAKDVPYLSGARQPRIENGPIPGKGTHVSKVKNPLASEVIGVRAFSAPMLPPGEQASGFFYFQTGNRPGAKAYLTGIKEAGSEQELFYFEIPLSNDGTP